VQDLLSGQTKDYGFKKRYDLAAGFVIAIMLKKIKSLLYLLNTHSDVTCERCPSSNLPPLSVSLRPWIRHFMIIISAWWLQTSSKLSGKKSKKQQKSWKWTTPKRVRIRPKYTGCANIAFSWQEDKDGTNKTADLHQSPHLKGAAVRNHWQHVGDLIGLVFEPHINGRWQRELMYHFNWPWLHDLCQLPSSSQLLLHTWIRYFITIISEW